MWTSRYCRIVLLSLLVCFLVSTEMGCPVNTPDPPVDRDVSFATEIQPLFSSMCASCHSEGGFADNAGIPLRLGEGEALDAIVSQSSSQDASFTLVVPSDSANSLLFLKVSEDNPPVGSTMPLVGARLSSEDLGLIRDWIDQGALDN